MAVVFRRHTSRHCLRRAARAFSHIVNKCSSLTFKWPEANLSPPDRGGGFGMHCSRCQHDNPAGMKFWGECAAPLTALFPTSGAARDEARKLLDPCSKMASGA